MSKKGDLSTDAKGEHVAGVKRRRAEGKGKPPPPKKGRRVSPRAAARGKAAGESTYADVWRLVDSVDEMGTARPKPWELFPHLEKNTLVGAPTADVVWTAYDGLLLGSTRHAVHKEACGALTVHINVAKRRLGIKGPGASPGDDDDDEDYNPDEEEVEASDQDSDDDEDDDSDDDEDDDEDDDSNDDEDDDSNDDEDEDPDDDEEADDGGTPDEDDGENEAKSASEAESTVGDEAEDEDEDGDEVEDEAEDGDDAAAGDEDEASDGEDDESSDADSVAATPAAPKSEDSDEDDSDADNPREDPRGRKSAKARPSQRASHGGAGKEPRQSGRTTSRSRKDQGTRRHPLAMAPAHDGAYDASTAATAAAGPTTMPLVASDALTKALSGVLPSMVFLDMFPSVPEHHLAAMGMMGDALKMSDIKSGDVQYIRRTFGAESLDGLMSPDGVGIYSNHYELLCACSSLLGLDAVRVTGLLACLLKDTSFPQTSGGHLAPKSVLVLQRAIVSTTRRAYMALGKSASELPSEAARAMHLTALAALTPFAAIACAVVGGACRVAAMSADPQTCARLVLTMAALDGKAPISGKAVMNCAVLMAAAVPVTLLGPGHRKAVEAPAGAPAHARATAPTGGGWRGPRLPLAEADRKPPRQANRRAKWQAKRLEQTKAASAPAVGGAGGPAAPGTGGVATA